MVKGCKRDASKEKGPPLAEEGEADGREDADHHRIEQGVLQVQVRRFSAASLRRSTGGGDAGLCVTHQH